MRALITAVVVLAVIVAVIVVVLLFFAPQQAELLFEGQCRSVGSCVLYARVGDVAPTAIVVPRGRPTSARPIPRRSTSCTRLRAASPRPGAAISDGFDSSVRSYAGFDVGLARGERQQVVCGSSAQVGSRRV